MQNIDLHRELSLKAACERRLLAEGKRFSSALAASDLVGAYAEHATTSKILLELHGYESKVSEKIAGYAELTYKKSTVFVPYTVANFFPTPNKFEKIYNIAQILSVSQPAHILVSGSGALSGAVYAIGDLDFCEYFERFDGRYINELASRACKSEFDDALLPISVKWSSHRLQWPFKAINELLSIARSSFASQNIDALENWKVDYVGQLGNDLILPITNMCIPVEFDNWEATATGKSWAFQEVLISSDGNPPRQLSSLSALGSYINWLRTETGKFLERNDHLKAAKRTISLANAMFRFDVSRDVTEILCGHSLTQFIKKATLEEAKSLLELRGNPNCDLLRSVNEMLSLIGEVNAQELEKNLEYCLNVIEGFLESFDCELEMVRAQY